MEQRCGSLALPAAAASAATMIVDHDALRRTLSWYAVKRSLIVAIVVGTALNAINQGAEIVAGEKPVIWKLALTYVVPFLVASYGSYAAFRTSRR